MSNNPGDEFKPSDDAGVEGGHVADTAQDDYQSRTGQSQIPVQKDSAPIEDPIDPNTADSDEQLAQDDKDAIDQSNVVQGRTRGAKPDGGYTEPGDEEGLPADDGTSRVAQ